MSSHVSIHFPPDMRRRSLFPLKNVPGALGCYGSVQGRYAILLLLVSAMEAHYISSVPEILEHPSDTYVAPNESAILHCRTSGRPPPAIKWFKNGSPHDAISVSDDSLKMAAEFQNHFVARKRNALKKNSALQFPDGSLFFTKVRAENDASGSDVGYYHCSATNPSTNQTSYSESSYLGLAVAPAINIVPRNLVVGRGRKVILECHVVGSPMPAIFWSKETKEDEEEEDDDENSPQSIRDSTFDNPERFSVSDQGALTLNSAKVTDSGVYTCRAANQFGISVATATLEVKELDTFSPPMIMIGPRNKTLPIGSNVTLRCWMKGHAKLFARWLRGGQPLVTLNNPRFRIVEEEGRVAGNIVQRLEIIDVRLSDSASYSCKAITELGFAQWSSQLTIVQPSSSSSSSPSSSLKSSSLSSSASSSSYSEQFNYPHMSMSGGHKKNKSINNNNNNNNNSNSTITITDNNKNDDVITPNENGSEFDFVVRNVTAVDQSETGVLITWELPEMAAEVTCQVETFTPDINEGWQIVSVVDGSVDKLQVTSLRDDTAYVFVVRCRNRHGVYALPSHPSSAIRTRSASIPTDQSDVRERSEAGLPHDPSVRLISALALNSTSLLLKWEVSRGNHDNDLPTQVLYRALDDNAGITRARIPYNEQYNIADIGLPPSEQTKLIFKDYDSKRLRRTAEYVLNDLKKSTWYEVKVMLRSTGQTSNSLFAKTEDGIASGATPLQQQIQNLNMNVSVGGDTGDTKLVVTSTLVACLTFLLLIFTISLVVYRKKKMTKKHVDGTVDGQNKKSFYTSCHVAKVTDLKNLDVHLNYVLSSIVTGSTEERESSNLSQQQQQHQRSCRPPTLIHDFQKYRLQRQQQLNQAPQHRHPQQLQQHDDIGCNNYTEIYAEIPDSTPHTTTKTDEDNNDEVFTKDICSQVNKDKSANDRYYDSVSQLLLKRPQLHNPRAYRSTKLPQQMFSYNYHQRHSTSQQQQHQQQQQLQQRQRINSDETQGKVQQQLQIHQRHRQQQQPMKNYRDGKPFKTTYSEPCRPVNNDNNNRIEHGNDID